ncbi:MAG: MBL fold metallo-hydrolase [Chloroflexia bacterium]|nr:MBL fold metallo-hydrolase [Chloroflexia bacterium]
MAGQGKWRVLVLGAGTALPSSERDNTYLALAGESGVWLIDCASAPYQGLLCGDLVPERLRGVILTHSHPDHIYGLAVLLFQLSLSGYGGCLEIYGLLETLRVARQIVQSFTLGSHCAAHRWNIVAVREREQECLFDEDIRVHVGRVLHSRPALGVRMEGQDGGIMAYSGDTGPCAGVVGLARGAHWLLHECTVAKPMAGHSTPEDVARTALQAGVSKVGIVHYDPAYVVVEEELRRRIREAGFVGEVRVLEQLQWLGWWD